MKVPFSILLLLFSVSLFAQQYKFKEIYPTDKDLRAPVFSRHFSEIFVAPETWTSITILAEELGNVSQYDFSKLVNLELVQVQFSFYPDSSDAAKKAYIEKIHGLMKNMIVFAKCPKLKNVIFGVGERIYLTKEECQPKGLERKNEHLLYKRCAADNLKNAWTSFGGEVSMLLPQIEIYGFTMQW